MIEVRNLVKRHGKHEILRGISMLVKKGETAVIIGPSGGGKSTFLRCINGLETFDDGVVRVGDHTLSHGVHSGNDRSLLEMRRSVGMVFQQFNLFPHMNVIENVMVGPKEVLKQPHDVAYARAVELLDKVGLASFKERKPSRLSGGQQQRVAIARALATAPDAILFDEPTSALDPRMTGEVLAVLQDLAKAGQTMVVVTHAMSFCRRVADTVYIFEEGRVLEFGPPEQIFENPKMPGTAVFLREAAESASKDSPAPV